MTEVNENENQSKNEQKRERSAWGYVIRGMWRSPLGLLGVTMTTVSATLMMFGVIVDILGLVDNPYSMVVTYMILPGIMTLGLLLIPLAAYLRRRQWVKYGVSREHLHINLSDHKHRKFVVLFIVLTVVIVSIMGVIGYEGYHFTDSPYFCGKVCHQVMEPEYTVYKRSPHAKVACVECHIGPGAEFFVKAKISGMRQVAQVMTESYNRPIPAPVEHLRPARDTCEHCHWPEKFHGKKVKTFTRFSNSDQKDPEKIEVALHIGGRNPVTSDFEGIHWHVSKDVEVKYLPANEKRTKIAKVQVTRPDGSKEEFVDSYVEIDEEHSPEWRVMDCIDCHNRPTHIYDMPEERVDFGLLSRRINPDIPGIRADSLNVLTHAYASRDDAREQMVARLLDLQQQRHPEVAGKFEADIRKAGEYLLQTYIDNVWPRMNVNWGTYKSHLGHQFADDGYGCWRCHDEMHENADGDTITQDCSLCHDEPDY